MFSLLAASAPKETTDAEQYFRAIVFTDSFNRQRNYWCRSPIVELILGGDTVVKHFPQGSIKWAQQKLHTCWLQELAVLMEAQ